MVRYARLWKKFSDKPFAYDEIETTLKLDDKRVISVFINELKTAGWINVELDKNDARKRLYTLKNPELIVGEIGKLK